MPTKTRAPEYLAKAKQYEQRAKKIRDLKDREWHATLARAYRMLAEAEKETATRRLPLAA
jgi:archaellum biogenesis protein FlaJ (TadC family)